VVPDTESPARQPNTGRKHRAGSLSLMQGSWEPLENSSYLYCVYISLFHLTALTSFPLASEQGALTLEACRLWTASGDSPAQTYSGKKENKSCKWGSSPLTIFHAEHSSRAAGIPPPASLFLVTETEQKRNPKENHHKTCSQGLSWWWEGSTTLGDPPLQGWMRACLFPVSFTSASVGAFHSPVRQHNVEV
jgi:hypothetical protein